MADRQRISALSAQPSPGGQDVLFIEELAELRRLVPSVNQKQALDAAIAALAARQPVGEPVIDYEDLVDQAKDLIQCGCSVNGAFDWLLEQLTDGEALAAPPAQAVDLGEVCALLHRRIEQWRSHLPADPGAPGTREIETKGEHDYNNDVRIYREGIAVMEEVLSKIDGQAVGNG